MEFAKTTIKQDNFTATEKGWKVSLTPVQGKVLVLVETKDGRKVEKLLNLPALALTLIGDPAMTDPVFHATAPVVKPITARELQQAGQPPICMYCMKPGTESCPLVIDPDNDAHYHQACYRL